MKGTPRVVLATLVAASVALGLTWSPAQAEESRSYIYVTEHGGGSDLYGTVDTPTHDLAPFGFVEVVASGSSMSLHLDDHLVLDGQEILISISTPERRVLRGCVPVRTIVPVPGVRPGDLVTVWVGHSDVPVCSGLATTGVLTISGVIAQ